jgi:hypothetical protein
MPLKYWDEAFLVATYLINQLPTKVLDFLHALDKLIQEKLNYAGLVVYTRLVVCAGHSSPNTQKLQFRFNQCVFLGYSNLHKGFKCLDIAAGRVYISCDVVFDETFYPFSKLNPNAGTCLRS